MGNSLERDIKPGEEVVIASHMFHRGLSLKRRVFVCESGGGMSETSSGRQINGRWKYNKKGADKGVVFGYWISVKETREWRTKNQPKSK